MAECRILKTLERDRINQKFERGGNQKYKEII